LEPREDLGLPGAACRSGHSPPAAARCGDVRPLPRGEPLRPGVGAPRSALGAAPCGAQSPASAADRSSPADACRCGAPRYSPPWRSGRPLVAEPPAPALVVVCTAAPSLPHCAYSGVVGRRPCYNALLRASVSLRPLAQVPVEFWFPASVTAGHVKISRTKTEMVAAESHKVDERVKWITELKNKKGRWDLCANSAGDDMVAYSAGANFALHMIIIMLGQITAIVCRLFEAKQRSLVIDKACHSGLVHQLGAFAFAPKRIDQDLAVRFDKRCLISRLADCLEPVPGTPSIWSSTVHAHPASVVCSHHPVLFVFRL
ncbi:hypothetical protein U9M48_014446, partial [Paspalum notatum var. saurae]